MTNTFKQKILNSIDKYQNLFNENDKEQEKIAFKRSFCTTGFTPDNYQLMNQAAEIYIDKLAEGCDHFLAYSKAMEFYDYWAYYDGGDE